MDTKRAEKLVEEILKLDPSLKSHEADIRVFLLELSAARPQVEIDSAFVTNLRRSILATPLKSPSPFSYLSTLALRLAPLGAVALLLLTLLPQRYDGGPIVFPDPSNDPRILQINTGSDVTHDTSVTGTESYGSAEMDSVRTMSIEAEPSVDMKQTGMGAADISTFESMIAPEESYSNAYSELTLTPQSPGMSIYIDAIITPHPGYVALYSAATDGVEPLGVSPLIPYGTTESVAVPLNRMTTSGETYLLRFHIDNGDQKFDPLIDRFELSPSGEILSTELFIE